MRRRVLAPALALLLSLTLARVALGQATTPDEAPPPDSAGGLVTAAEASTATDTTQVTLTARERRSRRNMGVWLLESKLTAQLRTYSRSQEKVNGDEVRATAAGGWVRFRSGRWRDVLAFRAALYLSMRLHADSSYDPSQILAPDGGSLLSLGVLNLEGYWHDHVFTVGRQDLSLPLVNKSDTRMIPRTFLSAMGQGPIAIGWTWAGGYIARMKERDSEHFAPMAQVAGASSNEGMMVLGARRLDAEGRQLTGGLFWYLVPNVHTYGYGELSLLSQVREGFQVKVGAQAVDMHSLGSGPPAGDATYFAGRMAFSRSRLLTTLAASITTGNSELVDPYGEFRGYTSPMNVDFTRSGEKAWLVSASYRTKALLDGVSLFLAYAQGSGGVDPASDTRFSRQAFEATIDVKPGDGSWRGFWFRLRGVKMWQPGANPDAYDVRLIGYYDVPIPWPPRTSTQPPSAPPPARR